MRLGNAKRSPFPDETFDVLDNAYMLYLVSMEEIVVGVSEFKRVLKSGGKIVLVDISRGRQEKTCTSFCAGGVSWGLLRGAVELCL